MKDGGEALGGEESTQNLRVPQAFEDSEQATESRSNGTLGKESDRDLGSNAEVEAHCQVVAGTIELLIVFKVWVRRGQPEPGKRWT